MQGADCFSGVGWPPVGKVETVPVVNEHPEGQTVVGALCPLGCGRCLAVSHWVTPLGHVAHDRSGGVSRIR